MMEALNKKPIRHIAYFFIIASFVSLLYSIIKGRYNGDFLGVKVTLPVEVLLFNFLFNIFPFVVVYWLYAYYKKKLVLKRVSMPLNLFYFFLLFLIVWNISVTLLYGVGVMGKLSYDAPAYIKPIIQIMNRFNYTYATFIYILLVDKKNRKQFFLVILLLVLAYLRAGLGVFLYLAMIYYVKYFDYVKKFFSIRGMIKLKRLLPVIFLIAILQSVVGFLYGLRDELRGQTTISLIEDPITGMLVGRLSSLSDSAFILQESDYFEKESQKLDFFYYLKQALGGIFSVGLIPKERPEQFLIRYHHPSADGSISYMAGTNGNLYIAFMKSPLVFLMNLLLIIILITLVFKTFKLLRFNYAEELAAILLFYVMLSGVANELSFLWFSIFVLVVFFLFVNSLRRI